MKNLQAHTIRLVAAMLVAMAVIGLSSLAMHAPIQNQNPLARSLKSIQTDKATLFYADQSMQRCYFVEVSDARNQRKQGRDRELEVGGGDTLNLFFT